MKKIKYYYVIVLNNENLTLDSTKQQNLLYAMYIYTHIKNNAMDIVFFLD